MANKSNGSQLGMVSSDLHVKIAWLYHVEGMTQEAIANLLKISRIRVMRSLSNSSKSKVVVTTINASASDQIALERMLETRWRLESAVVVPTPSEVKNLERSIGHAVARFIDEAMQDGMTLAIGGGATLHSSLDYLERRELQRASVVGLVGGLPNSRWINPSIVASRVAQRLGAESYQITAPVIVDAPDLRDRLWAQPTLQDVHERACQADLAILTVGEMAATATVFNHAIAPIDLLQPLREAGAVANILSYFVNRDGVLVDHEINRRIMAIPPTEIAALPRVVLAAGGAHKIDAILAALTAVRAQVLITDLATASQLLAAAPDPG
ncbi:sugar-binding transcriptional regulator [Pikeienuella piscinae]|uniref:Sugar-binding transcriptional regulator n=1 Tax=Pikeienuella piscinae TaxID=2748098 RepID=A0A7L5BX71_9RHOB|nr:sugar-binding domain-containing protein [Pikeienuella piscinae]QIE54189.1 sugar-binding transcriptional regulator [Pikeienuella piscinae]